MPTSKDKKILGIDPGYGRLGYAVLADDKLIDAGCFETPKDVSYENRLRGIGIFFEKLIKKHEPSFLAIEKLFLNTNQKTAMRVAETRGAVLYLSRGLEIKEFSPPEIKLAVCGYGRADKKQVERMIRLIFKTDAPFNDDAIDAIATAFTASGRLA